ncbi:MAG TPA: helix-turn-helix domain-containing protein [Streptosporangiaceae bacterium]|nr:helix-turn-helix domain-containing protein [Streptosporangiaceae bacterium]
MGYRLRMSDEIHDWLADLHETDPAAALLVGQALAALMSEGASLGAPLVVPVTETWPEDLSAALDASYQYRLDRLQAVRKRAAGAAWLVRDIQDQVDELESVRARLEDRRRRALEAGRKDEVEQAGRQRAVAERDITQARQLLPWLTETEAWLRTRMQRLQRRTDEFRVRKELLKATYVTARAEVQVAEEIPAASDPVAAAEAAGRLRDVTAEIRQELGRQSLPDGLLELRSAAPAAPAAPASTRDGDIRLIFGLEPPGTALLIAVLEGREATRDQYRDAVLLSADVLLEARAGQAPEASARAYDDTRSLAEEFFPGQAAEVDDGAAALAARNRGRTLTEERTRLGLTQTEVAQRMGVPLDQVAAIERADPGTTDVRTLVSYIEALGGRLTLTADFGGDRVILR